MVTARCPDEHCFRFFFNINKLNTNIIFINLTISDAKWLHDNRTDAIAPGGAIIERPFQFSDSAEVPFSTWNGFSLEGLPNRDSTKYREPYNLPQCETLLRGTFRYKGYCAILRDFHALELVTEERCDLMESCSTWAEFIAKRTGCKEGGDLVEHLKTVTNKVGEPLNVQGKGFDYKFCHQL